MGGRIDQSIKLVHGKHDAIIAELDAAQNKQQWLITALQFYVDHLRGNPPPPPRSDPPPSPISPDIVTVLDKLADGISSIGPSIAAALQTNTVRSFSQNYTPAIVDAETLPSLFADGIEREDPIKTRAVFAGAMGDLFADEEEDWT